MTHPTGETGPDGLRAELGLLDATMINVGTIVASAIFLMPAIIAAKFTAPGPAILVWVAGALVSLCGALCVAELGAAMPRAGGQFVYLSRAFGPVWGFLYGWGAAVVINPAAIAAIAVAFATYLGQFVSLGAGGVRGVAVASIVVLTVVNCFGVKLGAWIQNVLTILKLAAVVGIVVAALALGGGPDGAFRPFWPDQPLTSLIGPLGVAMVAVLWAYDGWIEITYVGSELRRPGRDMPLAIILSTLIVAALYVMVVVAFTAVLGHAAVARSERVAADAMTAVLGAAGATVVTAAVLVSTLGANNGIIFTAARISYAMARDGRFFGWAGTVSPRWGVPVTALLAQGAWSVALVFLGTYEQLATYVVFVSFLFYGMSCAGVMVLRRREPGMPRPYRAWGYPVTPLLFIAFALFLVGNTIVETPLESLVGGGLLALGLVFYFGLRWNRGPAR
jgi:basic amino acid/polyamine antiporter, APA family